MDGNLEACCGTVEVAAIIDVSIALLPFHSRLSCCSEEI